MPNVNQADGILSVLLEQKVVIDPPTGGATATAPSGGKPSGNRAWAQQTAGPSQHDSNNNVPVHAVPAKKVVTTASVAVTAAPGRSPMVSPRPHQEAESTALVNGGVPPRGEATKANAIQQTDVVPPAIAIPQKKLSTNTVSVTATPAAINGGAEKPQAVSAPVAAAPPSSWASLFASSQRPADGANGAAKKLVAVVPPFEGTQIQQGGTMSYSAASASVGLQTATTTQTSAPANLTEEESKSSQADRRGFKLGGKLTERWIRREG